MSVAELESLASEVHAIKNVGASIASGSFPTAGMLIRALLCAHDVGNCYWRYLHLAYPGRRRGAQGASSFGIDGARNTAAHRTPAHHGLSYRKWGR